MMALDSCRGWPHSPAAVDVAAGAGSDTANNNSSGDGVGCFKDDHDMVDSQYNNLGIEAGINAVQKPKKSRPQHTIREEGEGGKHEAARGAEGSGMGAEGPESKS